MKKARLKGIVKLIRLILDIHKYLMKGKLYKIMLKII